jgi:hypothetical protein
VEVGTVNATVVRAVAYAAAAGLLGVVVGTVRESSVAAGIVMGLAVGVGVLGGLVLFEAFEYVRG